MRNSPTQRKITFIYHTIAGEIFSPSIINAANVMVLQTPEIVYEWIDHLIECTICVFVFVYNAQIAMLGENNKSNLYWRSTIFPISTHVIWHSHSRSTNSTSNNVCFYAMVWVLGAQDLRRGTVSAARVLQGIAHLFWLNTCNHFNLQLNLFPVFLPQSLKGLANYKSIESFQLTISVLTIFHLYILEFQFGMLQ